MKISSATIGKIFGKQSSTVVAYMKYHDLPFEPGTYTLTYKSGKTVELNCAVMTPATAIKVCRRMFPDKVRRIPVEWAEAAEELPVVAAKPAVEKVRPSALPNIPQDPAQRMSSREIAELTGKQHAHVMRDIREMLEGLGKDVSSFGSIFSDAYGREQQEFRLPFEEAMCLVSGYRVDLRMAVIKRWKELEQNQPKLPNFSDEVEAAKAWVEAKEAEREAKRLALESETALAVVAPKAEAFDKIAATDGLMTITEVAKLYNVQPRKVFIPLLKQSKWVYRLGANSSMMAHGDKLKDGLLLHKVHTVINPFTGLAETRTQVMFTSKGVTEVEKLLRS